MATAKSPLAASPGPRLWLRRIGFGLAALIFLLALIFVWNRESIYGQLGVGAAYGARVACSCHYVGGRSLDDCRKDFEPGMETISLSKDDSTQSVTASVPLLASATATYREGWGCMLAAADAPE